MTFTVLPAGATVFLDANTLLYHFTADPKYGDPCTDLIERIERQELTGFISTAVISEVAHRMMTIEAADQSADLLRASWAGCKSTPRASSS